jgi:2-dehydropantoate 2-reductase
VQPDAAEGDPGVAEHGEAGSFAIVGAGSLGVTFAAVLADSGARVTLLARPSSAGQLLAAGELRLEGALTRRVPVSAEPAGPGTVVVVDDPARLPATAATLFTPKGHQLEAAVGELAGSPIATGASWVAGFQNGVVKDDLLAAAFGSARTVGAATVLGAQRTGAGEVVVASLGMSYLGELDGPVSPRVLAARDAFVAAGLPCEAVEDARSLLWAKFANAVGIFAVSVLTGLPTAELFARRPLALAYRSLIEEVDAVARAEGVTIGDFPSLTIRTYLEGTPDEMAELIASRFAGHTGPPSFSSMAQDVAAGRPTEVAQIFGDLARRGRRLGVATPQTDLVNNVISGIDLSTIGAPAGDRPSASAPGGTKRPASTGPASTGPASTGPASTEGES